MPKWSVRRWSIGTNDLYFTSCLYLDEMPLHVYLLDFLRAGVLGLIDPIGQHIKLPKIPIWPKGRDDAPTTLRDWYGDLGQLYFVKVNMPLFDYVWNSGRIEEHSFDLPYFYLRERFRAEFKQREEQSADWRPAKEEQRSAVQALAVKQKNLFDEYLAASSRLEEEKRRIASGGEA